MTDREKLIELLDEATEKLKELCGGLNDHDGNGVRADYLIAHGVVISNLETTTMQQWIPVAERLPEDTSKVLAVVKSVCGKGNPHIQLVWYGTNGFHISDPDFGYLNMNRYVTHWMPLPQPPEGE